MKLKRQFIITAGNWLALAALMSTTDPSKLPVLMLIVPFLLLFGALLQSWTLALVLHALFVRGNTIRPTRRVGASLSAVTVLLIILQSLGQLTLRDVVTVLAIGLIGYLYVVRGRMQPKKP